MSSLQHSLVEENRDDLQHRIDIACKNSAGYKPFIASLLTHGATLEHNGEPDTHPIILLNALKNILSENPTKPSRNILSAMVQIVSGKPLRVQKYNDLLHDLKVGGVNGSIFFMDLEDALQNGDRDQSFKEAARLYTVTDNPVGVLECVAELALQSIQHFGQFIFHLLRASAFNPTHENTWLFTCCGIEEVAKIKLPDAHACDPIIMNTLVSSVLDQSDPKLLTDFAAMMRLWEKDYLRSRAFKREIGSWLSSLNISELGTGRLKVKPDKRSGFDNDLTELGNIQFIKLTEDILTQLSGNLPSKMKEKVLLMDALRYFVNGSPNQYQAALIRERIQEII